MNWWAFLGYSSYACAKISFCDDVIYTECHGLWLGLPTVPYFPGRPVFRGLCPESRLGLPGTQNVPHFREAKVKIFWCDATPIYIKFHPETLKLVYMGREHYLIWRCVSFRIWSVKSELSSLKMLPECTITRNFKTEISKKNLWGGAQPRSFSADCWQPWLWLMSSRVNESMVKIYRTPNQKSWLRQCQYV